MLTPAYALRCLDRRKNRAFFSQIIALARADFFRALFQIERSATRCSFTRVLCASQDVAQNQLHQAKHTTHKLEEARRHEDGRTGYQRSCTLRGGANGWISGGKVNKKEEQQVNDKKSAELLIGATVGEKAEFARPDS